MERMGLIEGADGCIVEIDISEGEQTGEGHATPTEAERAPQAAAQDMGAGKSATRKKGKGGNGGGVPTAGEQERVAEHDVEEEQKREAAGELQDDGGMGGGGGAAEPDADKSQRPTRRARARFTVATWNARAPGNTNLEAVAEEAEGLVKERMDVLCMQECAVGRTKGGAPSGGHGK